MVSRLTDVTSSSTTSTVNTKKLILKFLAETIDGEWGIYIIYMIVFKQIFVVL